MRHSILSILYFISSITYTVAAPWYGHKQPRCLTDSDVKYIVDIWTALWTAHDLDHIGKIIAPNFEFFEEDDTDGKNIPHVTGISDFKKYLIAINDPATEEAEGLKESPVFYFHDCDQIALRWKETAITTGINKKKWVFSTSLLSHSPLLILSFFFSLCINYRI